MIKELYTLWENSPLEKKILIITGEEISAASGLFDYNLKKKTLETLSEILNIDTLLLDPQRLWGWILNQRESISKSEPNKAHMALVKLEEFYKDNFALITHTTDNLHSSAGNYRIIEMKGNIFRNKTMKISEYPFMSVLSQDIPKGEHGQILRPDMILDGENIEKRKVLQAHILAQQSDIVFLIGSQLKDQHIAELPQVAKRFNEAKIIEINYQKSFCPLTDIYIKEKSIHILPMLVNLIIDLEVGIFRRMQNSS